MSGLLPVIRLSGAVSAGGMAWLLLLSPWLSAGEPRQWVAAWRLNAPEARQAAAADRHYLYAIENRRVARYDRRSGRRVDESRGEALHLNSGFFWQGELYCAHSNYPALPEESEIKRLDPASMQLTTFHRFAGQEGSLTWAVCDGRSWWCHFAFYGDQKARSYLARFENWQEMGRWRFPPNVLAAFGEHSASCGLWFGGRLLISGHDRQELYLLELPTSGDELVYRATLPAPFTGQGFALDPVTGGLVGIDRARRQLVLAVPR